MEIGGYFELEIRRGNEYHSSAIRLNTGRNAFEYILRVKKYKKVYMPYYTCNVMFEPINKLNLNREFYSINGDFYPIFDFEKVKQDEVFVYTNYFGICDRQIGIIKNKIKNIIIDNSQAFFSKPIDSTDTIYSPRKFFGVPDGSYLYTDKFIDIELEQDYSGDRFEHLIGRVEKNAEAYYQLFQRNNVKLKNQPIKKMSKITKSLLESIDYNNTLKIRQNNFEYLHKSLFKTNELKIENIKNDGPLVYPYLTKNGSQLRKILIKNKVYVANYWPNVLELASKEMWEYYLAENLVPLPIDQRYKIKNIKEILDLIKNENHD